MDTSHLLTFVGASILLTLAPGPDILFVITLGISRGKKAAVTTALGLCSGIIAHTMAAALGISAIFYTSAIAFQVLKYAGAAYLLYLAWKTLKEKGNFRQTDNAPQPDGWALFRRGIVMNLLNPKVSLFFLAFLPQFVNPQAGSIAGQMILLGLIFMIQAVIIFCAVGTFSGYFGNHILSKPKVSRALGWVSAAVFAGLGIRLALAEK